MYMYNLHVYEIMRVLIFSHTAVPCPSTQSPVNTACSSSRNKAMWSSVWPGVATTRNVAPSVLSICPLVRKEKENGVSTSGSAIPAGRGYFKRSGGESVGKMFTNVDVHASTLIL